MTNLNGVTTIAAISTPPGAGGIATIRVSGPQTFEIVQRIWRGRPLADMPSHSVRLGTITDESGEPLDQGTATLFRAPKSYTGEDTVELTLHGSPWIQRRVLEALVNVGATPAARGEFTQRAFLNGRIDLAQVEGVADLIAASSRRSARVALQQVTGDYSSRLAELRDRLTTLASLLELELDFSEEEVEFADRSELRHSVEEIMREVRRLTESYRRGKIFKEGLPVGLAGTPNAGKSSLLNLLLDEQKALVTDIPGTTRDIIEDTVEINGLLVRFADTAGLRETEDVVENLGIERAKERIRRSAVALCLIDPTQPFETQLRQLRDIRPEEGRVLYLLTKADLLPDLEESLRALKAELLKSEADRIQPAQAEPNGKKELYKSAQQVPEGQNQEEPSILLISTKSGYGIEELKKMITDVGNSGEAAEETIVSNLRHYRELTEALPYLERLTEGLRSALPTDLLAMELRGALRHLSAILGAIDSESILSTIFSRFCIGK